MAKASMAVFLPLNFLDEELVQMKVYFNLLNIMRMHATQNHHQGGGICMHGRIFPDQKCPVCGGSFEHETAGGASFARITRTNKQQAVFESSSVGRLGNGFLISGRRNAFSMGFDGKWTRGPMIPETTGQASLWDLKRSPINGLRLKRRRSSTSLITISETTWKRP